MNTTQKSALLKLPNIICIALIIAELIIMIAGVSADLWSLFIVGILSFILITFVQAKPNLLIKKSIEEIEDPNYVRSPELIRSWVRFLSILKVTIQVAILLIIIIP